MHFHTNHSVQTLKTFPRVAPFQRHRKPLRLLGRYYQLYNYPQQRRSRQERLLPLLLLPLYLRRLYLLPLLLLPLLLLPLSTLL
jgi:hypothetical protein